MICMICMLAARSRIVGVLFYQFTPAVAAIFDVFFVQGCTDTGAPIMVPVGQETLGRIMNVIGEPVDERGPINSANHVRFTSRQPSLTSRQDSVYDVLVDVWQALLRLL